MSYMVYGFTEKQIVLQEVATESEAQKLASQFVKHEVHGFYVDSADFMFAMSSILMCDGFRGYLVCEQNTCEDSKINIRVVEKKFDFDFDYDFDYDIAYAATSNNPLVVFDVFLTHNGMGDVTGEFAGTIVATNGKVLTYDEYNHIEHIETM